MHNKKNITYLKKVNIEKIRREKKDLEQFPDGFMKYISNTDIFKNVNKKNEKNI